MALTTTILLWCLLPGDHPLQRWVKFQLEKWAIHLFGDPSLAVLLAPRIAAMDFCSPVLNNRLYSYTSFSSQLQLSLPSQEVYVGAPIWGEPQFLVHGLPLHASSSTSRCLIAAGVTHIGDLWNFPASSWKSRSDLTTRPTMRFTNGLATITRQLLPPTIFDYETPQFF